MSRVPKQPCACILASKRNGTLYVGVTSNLVQRVWQHKRRLVAGFARDNNVHRLMWFEQHLMMEAAIEREKVLKRWNRAWKVRLIETRNPYWRDLYDELL
ncbi:MAG TPA: GIY-YIG nuclease family protein [Rhodanobacteraceae bacterium]|nr:GIY-YIG nuclease family protein [Rhodanobacteraceae bacterium]